ncbi:uncharacterized protein LOC125524137 isoform X3 [Triticum urartu]|uniref:uncharacterized protein LOC125524137 isoform X3 n=1 Tax=Triticum urartu TaxID=4572 RepID=UPI002044856B|nr:uncharacterized protein LOC125524137 isoform X3 [Triticum urartu]
MYSPGGEDDGLYGEHGCEQDEPVSVTSRLSVKQVVTVVQSFGEYKRWLVSEIGFGGMLKLPLIAKIDLKLSLWVMRKVEVVSRMIVIDKDRKLLFTPEDFHKVFGVLCGNRDVRGRDGDISIRSVEFIKDIIGMNRSAAHSLKATEIFLYRDINESSTKMEKDCFQIAFIIFVLGYVIAPSTKHDYMTIDFWGAVANPELIGQFNWCQYAMDKLMGAVIKLKHDDEERAATINLFGCHFFFQIFLLDNIDLGLFNMKHDVLPRVQCFDAKRLREMIIMAYCPKNGAVSYVPATLRPADDVCYKSVLHMSDAVGGTDIDVQKDNPSCSRPVFNIGGVNPPLSAISSRASISKTSVEGSKSAHVVMPDPRSVGPIEFSSHVRQSCQDDPICIFLCGS